MDTVKIYLNFKINNVIKYVDYLTNNEFIKYIELNILKNCIYESYKMYVLNASNEFGNKHSTKYEYSAIKGLLRTNVNKNISEEDFNRLAASIYLALRIDENTIPLGIPKLDLDEFLSHFIQKEFKNLIKGHCVGLKKIYKEVYKTNELLIMNQCFINEYRELIASKDKTKAVISSLKYEIKALDRYKPKMIKEVEHTDLISKDLFKILLNNCAFDILKNLYAGSNKLVVINIPDDYVKTKSMVNYLLKTIDNDIIKHNIVLKFNYSQYVKYPSILSDIKELGFLIALQKEDMNYSNHSLEFINYTVLNYSENDKFSEFIATCQSKNIETIITGVDNLEKINQINELHASYYCSGVI